MGGAETAKTPGTVPAPLVVAPFSLWAWSRLRAAGVPAAPGGGAAAVAAFPVPLGAVHGPAALLTRGRRKKG